MHSTTATVTVVIGNASIFLRGAQQGQAKGRATRPAQTPHKSLAFGQQTYEQVQHEKPLLITTNGKVSLPSLARVTRSGLNRRKRHEDQEVRSVISDEETSYT